MRFWKTHQLELVNSSTHQLVESMLQENYLDKTDQLPPSPHAINNINFDNGQNCLAIPAWQTFGQAHAWIVQSLVVWIHAHLSIPYVSWAILQPFYAIISLSLESLFLPLPLATLEFVHLNSDHFDNRLQLICAFSINPFQKERGN